MTARHAACSRSILMSINRDCRWLGMLFASQGHLDIRVWSRCWIQLRSVCDQVFDLRMNGASSNIWNGAYLSLLCRPSQISILSPNELLHWNGKSNVEAWMKRPQNGDCTAYRWVHLDQPSFALHNLTIALVNTQIHQWRRFVRSRCRACGVRIYKWKWWMEIGRVRYFELYERRRCHHLRQFFWWSSLCLVSY